MVERDQLLGELDIKYNLYIFKLLQQKSLIMQNIQKQCDEQLNHIQQLLLHSCDNNPHKQSNTNQNSTINIQSIKVETESNQINGPPIITQILTSNARCVKVHSRSTNTSQQCSTAETEIHTNQISCNRTVNTSISHEHQPQIGLMPKTSNDNSSKKRGRSKSIKCPYCSKYLWKRNLKTHIRSHTGERPFKCKHPGCEKAYTRKDNLVSHTRVHTGEKPFKCNYPGCGKAFARKDRLVNHNCVHTERPFKCKHPGCEKAYTRKDNLVIHTRVHTGEKPFKCKYPGCEKAYARNDNLVSHTRVHTGEKPFKCNY
eukprot:458521_1